MSRMIATLGVLAAVVIHAVAPVATQDRPLTILSATPAGALAEIADAREIRIVFSEPMVTVGQPDTSRPAWFSIAPAADANFCWSGTSTLIATIDPGKPLPFATRFRVTIDAAAQSVSGRRLAAPFTVEFTTPTVRLLSAQWYRRDRRADSPAVIALRFNQPVRASDVLEHARVQYAPHKWRAPAISGASREWMERNDPAGLAQFERKVAAVQRVVESSDPVPVVAATSWDEVRFPRAPELVVIETAAPPSPEGWLAITIDERMPGLDGPERHAQQTTTVQLEPAFFVADPPCSTGCDPDAWRSLGFRRGIEIDALLNTLSVRDFTDGGRGREVKPLRSGRQGLYRPPDGHTGVALPDLGFDPQPPQATWLHRIDPSLRATDGQRLDYPWVSLVAMANARPVADWAGTVWEASGGPRIPFFARNVVDADVFQSRVDGGVLVGRALEWGRLGAPAVPPVGPNRRGLAGPPNAWNAHGIDLSRELGGSRTGTVWVAVRPVTPLPGAVVDRFFSQPRAALLQVTNLGLTVKDSPHSTLVFVTRLDNAAPVAGAAVAIVDRSQREVWRGITNAEGIALAPALPLRDARNPWQPSYVAMAEKDGDVAWVRSDWTGDVHPGSFGLRNGLAESSPVLRGHVITDRGVYSPGDEVRLKAIVRLDAPDGMRVLPPETVLEIEVHDARGQQMDRRTMPAGRWSSTDWRWTVPEHGTLGSYSVQMKLAAAGESAPAARGRFLVAAFRRPDFRVDATVSAAPPVLGTTLSGTLAARYLFGASIGAQPVRWWVSREIVHDVPRAIGERYPAQQFAFGYLPDDAEGGPRRFTQVVEKRDVLQSDGTIRASVPTESGADYAASYRFEGDVEGASGQHIANRATMVIHPASLYVGVSRPGFFVTTETPLTIRLVAADLDGTARANVPVTVELLREQWLSERRPDTPGMVSWSRRELPAGKWAVTTTAAAAPLSVPVKEGGRYILRASARDERGRPTRTEVGFYALGRGRSLWRSEGNRITLTPERRTWSPGETARLLVQSPWERATALVTTEREGIRTYRQTSITSMQDAIDVPITEADIPNVFVSVLLVKGRTSDDPGADESDPGQPAFRVGYAELNVDDASKRLRVDVSADAKEYRPRQEVRVDVAVRDAEGRPRASEVTVWAMDYGLLSLTGYSTPDVARSIYANKALQVLTQDNRSRLIGRRAMLTESARGQGQGGAGGGGRGQAFRAAGGVAGGMPAPPPAPVEFAAALMESVAVSAETEGIAEDVRTDFRPLVFWLGSAETDGSGRVSTTVTLPDSLTTYRIMAVAGDLSSHFGAGDAEIRTSKPVTLLPAFPRFLTRGDHALFGTVVTNGTAVAGDAVVSVRSLDPAVAFEGATTRTIRLVPGESAAVRFDAIARAPGAARVRISVTLGGETDAFELGLPVLMPARLETVAAYGDTLSAATEAIALPAGMLPTRGGLTVSLASTALVGLGESARYLDEYPYDCAEQKASRALALLLAADVGGAFAVAGARPEDQRAAGRKALQELYGYQCGNGAFALWPGRCESTSPYLTAYILHVMQVARSLQVDVDQRSIDRALDHLGSQLRQAPPEVQWWPVWGATQAYALKVLAEFGRKPAVEIGTLYQAAERLPIFALSYLADALAATGDRGPRYQDVLRRLTNALRTDADRAHVEEADDRALVWLWNSNVRATAVVLGGMARRRDADTFAAPLARWLLASRTNGRWGTTQENAVALEALVNYYRAFEAEMPQMSATVTLAGAPIGAATFAGRSAAAEQVHLAMPELIKRVAGAASADLVVSRQGTGRLFYTARLQYVPSDPPQPVNRGIGLARRYQRLTPETLGDPATEFAAGDLVRVTVTVDLPHEGRYVALTDALPAGFEPIDATLQTTATDLGAASTTQPRIRTWMDRWRYGGFEHVEKHDDRVIAFATRLAAGRHEFTYLARATTAGTFNAAGTFAEAMYAPEINGRGAAAMVTVK